MLSTTKVNPVLTYGMPVREVDSGATFISGFQIILNFSDYLALMNFHPPLPLLSTSTLRKDCWDKEGLDDMEGDFIELPGQKEAR